MKSKIVHLVGFTIESNLFFFTGAACAGSIQVERPMFWESIVSVIVKKNHKHACNCELLQSYSCSNLQT
jgi:hypothetical protein